MSDNTEMPAEPEGHAARREFLKRCGRYAAVTPPAMTMLLEVAAMPSQARASTIGRGGNGQGGNGNDQGARCIVTGKCPSGDFGSRVNRLAGIAVEGGNLL